MKPALRASWLAWGGLAAFVFVGGLAAEIASSASSVEIKLVPGESVSLAAFRLREDHVRLSLGFKREGGV